MNKPCSRPSCKRTHDTRYATCPACREFARLRARKYAGRKRGYDASERPASTSSNYAAQMDDRVLCGKCGAEMALRELAGHIRRGCW